MYSLKSVEKFDKEGRQLFHYLYLIHFEDGWGYLGQRQSHDPENDNYTGSGCKKFKEAIEKVSFVKTILKIIQYNKIKINLLETSYSKKYRKIYKEKYYNKIDGPPRGPFSTNPTSIPEIAAIVGKKVKDFYKNNPDVAKRRSEKLKQRYESGELIRKPTTPEVALKISKGNKGKKRTQECKDKISKGNKGKIRTEEMKNNVSKKNKGKKHTEEWKKKRSEQYMGTGNPAYDIDRKWINNGVEQTTILIEDLIPIGWKLGMLKTGIMAGENNPMYGNTGELSPVYDTNWINNGIISKHLESYKSLPKGFVYGKLNPRKWITNGIESEFVDEDLDIPDGWRKGRVFKEDKKGKKAYNNGVINIFLKEGDIIPDGFVKGGLKKGKKHKRGLELLKKKGIIIENGKVINLNKKKAS